MGKKKDLDFKKIKVKIGKSKPSNNVTKFNIKTAKIVLPGLNKVKEEKKNRDDTYFSCNEKDLMDNLKYLVPMIIESINEKKEAMNKNKLDLTQSVWTTVYRYKWVTPWDDIIQKFIEKSGSAWSYIWIIINNASTNQTLSVNEEAIRCANLYLQLVGDASIGRSSSKKAVIIIKRFMKSSEKRKKLLALDLAVSLAKYSPFALWYCSRWKSAVYVLGMLEKLLNNVDRHYESVINLDRFLSAAATILASVIDGNRAGSVFVGEHHSQIDDIKNPPFDDLFYENEEYIEEENWVVTDAHDKWDKEDVEIHTNFDLDKFLMGFSNSILERAVKMMPIADGCEKSLEKLLNIVKILSRCCMRINTTQLLQDFIEELIYQFPFVCEQAATVSTGPMDFKANGNINDVSHLSKKERKLKNKRMEIDKRMDELCHKAKANIDSKSINKLQDELNFHTIALIHQCLVSQKLDATAHVSDWASRCGEFIKSRVSWRNEVVLDWLSLGKQIIQLSYERCSQSATIISDLFVTFAREIFISSHRAAKVKRLSLAIFVDACLLANRSCSDTVPRPVIDQEIWDILLELIADEYDQSSSLIGPVSPHPTFVSTQAHYDATLLKAVYLLLADNYPGTSELFRQSDINKKTLLKNCFLVFRRNIKQTEYTRPRDWNNFFSDKLLQNMPNNFIWDYFTIDNVLRKDAIKDQLPAICSSIDDFLCQ